MSYKVLLGVGIFFTLKTIMLNSVSLVKQAQKQGKILVIIQHVQLTYTCGRIQYPKNIDNPCYVHSGDLVELSFTLRSITLGQVQKKEAFVTKLDVVVIIDKFGAKVCFSLFVTISNCDRPLLASV